MIGKQIISFIHLYTAALDMVAIDEAERNAKLKLKWSSNLIYSRARFAF